MVLRDTAGALFGDSYSKQCDFTHFTECRVSYAYEISVCNIFTGNDSVCAELFRDKKIEELKEQREQLKSIKEEEIELEQKVNK